MKITNKIIIAILIVFIFTLITGNVLFTNFFVSYVLDEENNHIAVVLDQTNFYLNKLNQKYQSFCVDWAKRDETYLFLQSKNPQYLEKNLIPEVFNNLKVNFIMFYNIDKQFVGGKYFDFIQDEIAPLPDTLVSYMQNQLQTESIQDVISSIIQINGSYYMISISKTADISANKPNNGYIIAGRMIDEVFIRDIKILTGNSILFTDISLIEPKLAKEMSAYFQKGQAIYIDNGKQNAKICSIYVKINAYHYTNDDEMIIKLDMPKDFYQQQMSRLANLLFLFTTSLIIIMVILFFFINRFMLKPIGRLTTKIKHVDLTADFIEKISDGEKGEISELATTIDNLINNFEQMRDQYKKTHETLEDAQSIAKIGSWELNLKTGQVNASKQAMRIYGMKHFSANLSAKTILKMTVPSDRKMHLHAFWSLMRRRKKINVEYKIYLPKEDKTKTLLSISKPEYGDDGKIVKLVGTVQDITKKKKIEEELKQSELRLRLILNSTGEGIFGIDLKGNCTFCNASALALLGYNNESELLGKNMHALIHHSKQDGSDYPIEECNAFHLFNKGESVHIKDETFWRADGISFPVDYSLYPQILDNKRVGAVITFTDNTNRKQAEYELRESERSKAVLLANLPGMAYRCNFDRDWTMLFVSEGCYELTGYNPEDLLYNNKITFNDLIQPEYRDTLWHIWIHTIKNKAVFKEEYTIKTATGETKWVIEQGRGVYNERDEVEAIEGLIIDITDRKKREDDIIYLSYHDTLTGLFNRKYYDTEKERLNGTQYLPLSVIIGDINGLKLINDAFGHAKGDTLITETAKILQSCLRESDIAARTGGDEFSILLPKTDAKTAMAMIEQMQAACKTYNQNTASEAYYINISLGYATKETVETNLNQVIKCAEDNMYKRKLLEHKSSHSAIVSSIKATMFERSQETEEHAERLVTLSKLVGNRLSLSQVLLDELELLSTLHDIGKVGIDNQILNKKDSLSLDEWLDMKKHPEIGYRIAMASPELVPIAEYILSHHEKWDGSGYPQGLKGTDIPLPARIIAVVDAYDAMTHDRPYKKAISKEAAIEEIKSNTGVQFDPEVVQAFLEVINMYEGEE